MLMFTIKAQGHRPIHGLYRSTRDAMDDAFRIYPMARSITVKAPR